MTLLECPNKEIADKESKLVKKNFQPNNIIDNSGSCNISNTREIFILATNVCKKSGKNMIRYPNIIIFFTF